MRIKILLAIVLLITPAFGRGRHMPKQPHIPQVPKRPKF